MNATNDRDLTMDECDALGLDVMRFQWERGRNIRLSDLAVSHPFRCLGCEWNGYTHRHNDAEDGPREQCCKHSCKKAAR